MGIFPGIQRAWMTIDHILFLWDYTDPRGSFYQYDGLDQARAPRGRRLPPSRGEGGGSLEGMDERGPRC